MDRKEEVNMSWGTFFVTFGAIFFAEIADKTQLVGMSMAARSGRPVTVWLACVLAYMLITGISVLAGAWVSKNIRPEIVRGVAGGMFIFIGLFMLLGKN